MKERNLAWTAAAVTIASVLGLVTVLFGRAGTVTLIVAAITVIVGTSLSLLRR